MSLPIAIPDTCKFVVHLPPARSIFDDTTVTEEIRAGGAVLAEITRNKGKKYKKQDLSFILGGQFGFDITSSYERGGAIGKTISSAIGGLNSFLSEFGGGLISQRAAVLTYKGSSISGIQLPFILINADDKSNFIKSHLDHLYRAVLPTIGDSGDLSIDDNGVFNVTGKALERFGVVSDFNAWKDAQLSKGGVTTKLISDAGTYINIVSKDLNKNYLGFYGFTAPLSYNPWNIKDIANPENSVGLKIGDYFEVKGGLVITDVKVDFSQATVKNNGPLYATGRITFQFVKLISHADFRKFFIKEEDSSIYEDVPLDEKFKEDRSIEPYLPLSDTSIKKLLNQ